MTCSKCGMPLGEAVRMGAEKHKCQKGVKKGVYPEPKPKPKPVTDDE